MNSLLKCLFFVLFAGLLAASPLQAATYYWINPTWGYVNDPANWDLGAVPGYAAGDRAAVNNGGLALIDATHTFGPNNIGSGQTIFSLFAGVGYPSAGPGAMQQSGGTVSTDSGLILGYYGTEASYGYYGISGGALNAMRATADTTYAAILVGMDHSGVFNQTAGTTTTVIAAGDGARTIVGWNTLSPTVDNLMNIRGGSFGVSGGTDYAFLLGFGGNVNVLNLGGTANVNLTGGTPIGRLLMGGGGALSVLNLGDVKSGLGGSGGTGGGGSVLTTASVHALGSPSIVNFHGGTLQASTSSPPVGYSLLDGVAGYVYSEGAVIDTQGFNSAISSPLEAPGGNGVTGIELGANHGSGFIGEPIVTLTDTGGSGTGATARAIVDLDPASPTFQQVTSIVVTNPGVNYSGPVSIDFTGGGPAAVVPDVGTIATSPNESGGLTKLGLGNLTLNAACTYTGPTVVEQGKLTLNDIGMASSGITVKNGAALGGIYTNLSLPAYPATVVEAGGAIASGTPGLTFYINTIAVESGAKMNFTITSGVADTISTNYLAPASGAAVVDVTYTGTPTNSVTPLLIGGIDSNVSFTLFGGGAPPLDSPDGVNGPTYLDYSSGSKLDLVLGGVLADTVPGWNAPAGGNWNDNTKWANDVDPIVHQHPFLAGDRALFGKTLGAGVIPISLNISPTLSSMIFASPSGGGESYNITPSDSSKTITLNSGIAQDWHITVLGGTHTVAADIKLGAGAGGSIIRSVDGSHLTLSGVVGNATASTGVNFVGNLNGGTGTGILTLSNVANTYTGPTTVTGGVIEVAKLANAGAASSLGATLDTTPANLILNNATLRYTGTAAATTDRGMTISGVSAIQLAGNTTFASSQIVGTDITSLTINGPGNMTLDSTTLTMTDEVGKGSLWIGDNVATVLNISGTSEVTARSLLVGKAGGSDAGKGGAIYQTGGIVNVQGDGINPYDFSFAGEVIGHSAYGYYKMAGGVLNMNVYARSGYNPCIVGLNATGVFDQTGGTVNNPATDNFLVGVGASSVMNVTGGDFHTSHTGPSGGIILGTFHDGTLNIGGGSTAATVDTAAGIVLLGRFEARGTVNLATNGTLKTGGIYNGATIIPDETLGTAIFNFHGGTLMVGSAILHPAVTSLMENLDHAYIYSEGAVIDTNGLDAAIAQNLESPSGSGIKRIDVGAGGGSGYIGTPVVTISGGTGSGATAVAVMNGDKVDHFVITNPGSGYDSADSLTVTLSGGGYATAASATIGTGTNYFATNVGGGLKKLGGGALTLTGALTYTGDTTVNEGTLNVAALSTPSATVTVKDGAVLNAASIVADTLVIGGVPETFAATVPEPGTLSLLALAILVGIGMTWRGRKS